MHRIIPTLRDREILRRFSAPATCDSIASLFPSKQTMYRRLAKLVRCGLLHRVTARTVPTKPRPKELYCYTADGDAVISPLHDARTKVDPARDSPWSRECTTKPAHISLH